MSTKHSPTEVSTPTRFRQEVDALLAQMNLAEKIGQITQVEKNSITPDDVREYAIGSILSGGGGNPSPNTPKNWAAMVRSYAEAALQTRLGIPLVYGVDAVHGHNNMQGAVLFPHNIGLGATRNPELVEKVAQATAVELLASNVHWTFAPALSVPQDLRWGRTFEGFSEDTAIVTELGAASLRGLQRLQENGQWVLATPKHFVADGGTVWGSRKPIPWQNADNWQAAKPNWQIDQGNAVIDEASLRAVHLAPYEKAIADGAICIMVSFSSWNDVKMHSHRYLLTDVLKGEMGFEGFLVSDWSGVDQLDADYYSCVVQTMNAGLDMIMVPYDYKRFIHTLTEAVEKGDVSETRIDDAVRRILYAKFALGLFENPFGNEEFLSLVGSDEHRALAREAVRQSLVLLKNEGGVLPLKRDISEVLIAGKAGHNIGLQSGGWSVDWQGIPGNTLIGTSILSALRETLGPNSEVAYSESGDFASSQKAEVGIAVVGEMPYAEGNGDTPDLHLSPDDVALIEKMRQQCKKLVVILVSGRPMILTEQLPLMDALVAAWLPGSEGQGVVDVLIGDYPFTGKLPFRFPRSMQQIPLAALKDDPAGPLFELGFGL